MPDFKLAPVSNLAAIALPPDDRGRPAQVFIQERPEVSLCSVLARKGADGKLADRVRHEFGIELPRTPRYASRGPNSLIWAGPGQWLAMADDGQSGNLEQRLRTSLAGLASIMDQSDGRTILRIGGPRARGALAKGLHVDLHPSAFRPGDTAISVVAHIDVHFWQVDETPTYEFAMLRSYAVAFAEWLVDSAAEYGIAAG